MPGRNASIRLSEADTKGGDNREFPFGEAPELRSILLERSSVTVVFEEPYPLFGGQVAAQALVAAGRTVPEDRTVHSLHAYFLRPGDPTVPILYDVDRIRDGRSFTTRRVVAIQHGRAIFNLQASFHIAEPSPNHQITMPEDLPDPESLPDFRTRMAPHREQLGEWYDRPRPIDIRHVGGSPFDRVGRPSTGQRVWMRADGRLPDDPTLHACIVTYASDMTLA